MPKCLLARRRLVLVAAMLSLTPWPASGIAAADTSLPTFSIGATTVTEGDSGAVRARFTVSASSPAGRDVTLRYGTRDGSATGSEDFQLTKGTVTFGRGQTTATITVSVFGDTADEPDETFGVILHTTDLGVRIAGGTGVGTIVDDDDPAQAGTLACAPDSYAFGLVQVGGVQSTNITCTAGGGGPVPVSQPSVTGADAGQFVVAQDQCNGEVLAVGDICTIQLRYAPTSPTTPSGPHVAVLNVPHGGAPSPESVSVSGAAHANATLTCSPNAIDFGTVVNGAATAPRTESCTNQGPQAITLGTPAFSGDDASHFSAGVGCGSVAPFVLDPGATCTFGIIYDPPVVSESSTSTLSIPHNGKGADGTPLAPETVAVAGSSVFIP